MMINNTLWIDDDYIKKAYPLPYNFDNGSLYPLINMAQVTSARDLIGACLYDRIVEGVDAKDLTADEATLFGLLQYYVAFATIKSASNLLATDIGNTPSGRDNLSDPEVVSHLKKEVSEKMTYMEGRVLDFILNTEALKGIATGGDCANDNSEVNQRFKDKINDTYSSPIFMRKRVDEDCTFSGMYGRVNTQPIINNDGITTDAELRLVLEEVVTAEEYTLNGQLSMVIVHNKGRNVSVDFFDNDGEVFFADYENTDLNTVTIYSTVPLSGTAIVR